MDNVKVPKINKVSILPNLFLRVIYDDGSIRYWRSKTNKEKMSVLKKGNITGLSDLTPEFYWINKDISLDDNNLFKINNYTYDGNYIYINGLTEY